MKVAVTGASGFIGRRVVRDLEAAGHEVVRLVRSEEGMRARTTRWALGEALPSSCENIDALVHLASSLLVERSRHQEAFSKDVGGTKLLIESIRRMRARGRVVRFIFISSQSASESAKNFYGRSKKAIEQLLNEQDEIIVRPGLVYGAGEIRNVAAQLEKLSRLPVLPVLATGRAIQPIHVDDLSQCIVMITATASPMPVYYLGAPIAIDMQQFVREIARRQRRKAPLMVKMPATLVKLAASLIDRASWGNTSLVERIDGLLGLAPMETSQSIKRLGFELRPLALDDHAPPPER